MISVQERIKRIEQAQAALIANKSTWVIQNPEALDGLLLAECQSCGRELEQGMHYFAKGYSCECTKGAKLKEAKQLSHADFLSKVRDRDTLKFLSKYMGMNKKIRALCLVCDYEWTAFAGSFKSHGCLKCSQVATRQNNLALYGVEFSSQRPEVQKRIHATMRSRYGVDHALQNKQLFNQNLKTAYAFHEVRLGDRLVQVQGYERHALKYLVEQMGIATEDIVCGIDSEELPSIPYEFRGKRHLYHPDLYIVSRDWIVEVKSEYTYTCDVERNEAKKSGCIEAGYLFKFMVMTRKGELREFC